MMDSRAVTWIQALIAAFGMGAMAVLYAGATDHAALRLLINEERELRVSHEELRRSVERLSQRVEDMREEMRPANQTLSGS